MQSQIFSHINHSRHQALLGALKGLKKRTTSIPPTFERENIHDINPLERNKVYYYTIYLFGATIYRPIQQYKCHHSLKYSNINAYTNEKNNLTHSIISTQMICMAAITKNTNPAMVLTMAAYTESKMVVPIRSHKMPMHAMLENMAPVGYQNIE